MTPKFEARLTSRRRPVPKKTTPAMAKLTHELIQVTHVTPLIRFILPVFAGVGSGVGCQQQCTTLTGASSIDIK